MEDKQIKEIKEIAKEIEDYFENYPITSIDEIGECSLNVAKLIGYIKAI